MRRRQRRYWPACAAGPHEADATDPTAPARERRRGDHGDVRQLGLERPAEEQRARLWLVAPGRSDPDEDEVAALRRECRFQHLDRAGAALWQHAPGRRRSG